MTLELMGLSPVTLPLMPLTKLKRERNAHGRTVKARAAMPYIKCYTRVLLINALLTLQLIVRYLPN